MNNSAPSNKFAFWYSYDAESRLYQLRTNNTDNYSTSTLRATYTYRADDNVSKLQYPGPYIQYSYDANRGWVTNIEEVALGQFRETLTYYTNGNIHTQTIINSGNPNWPNLNTTFSYDGLNRLTGTSVSGYSNYNESFSYDADGNFTNTLRGGLYYYQSGTNKLINIEAPGDKYYTYTYDNKGSVTGKSEASAGNIFTIGSYDRRNLPLSVTTPPGTFSYFYDDSGSRIIKQSPDSTRYYIRDFTGRTLAIYDITGTSYVFKTANLFGNGLIGRADANGAGYKTFYYFKDHLGSIRQTWDESGNIVAAQDYFSYGDILRSYGGSSPLERYKFTSKERDNESSLDYFGARYYESLSGRWMQVDPMADDNPDVSPYVYAGDNPINRTDPDGRQDSTLTYWLQPITVTAQMVPITEPFFGPVPLPIPAPPDINTANKTGQAVSEFLNRLNNINNVVKLGVITLITPVINSSYAK